MKTPGILLIEASLEGSLIPENWRRTQFDTISGLQKSLGYSFEVFHERIYDLNGLKNILAWCNDQNRRKNAVNGIYPTSIEFIHITSHGTKKGLELPVSVSQPDIEASEDDLAEAFSCLENAGIKTIVLSSCETGRNQRLAKRILETTGAQALIGYPETAHDNVCALAEQVLYYQLLKKRVLKPTDISSAVRKTNDTLVLIGENVKRCLYCWVKEKGEIKGPCPWWNPETEETKDDRSFVAKLAKLSENTSQSKEEKQLIRQILDLLV